jgi:hypothetical protein
MKINNWLKNSQLEHQIDVMVYHLYGLSYAEACVIDKELKEEDYRTSGFQLEGLI